MAVILHGCLKQRIRALMCAPLALHGKNTLRWWMRILPNSHHKGDL